MKKLFTLFTALLVVCVAYATNRYPDPTVSNSLGAATSAALTGDVIYLTDNSAYVNVKGTDDYTTIDGKNITIRAIDDKSPVVKLEVPIRVRNAGSVKFVGIIFDGTNLTGYDRFFYPSDNTNNTIEFEDCEFKNMSKYVIHVPSGEYKLSSLVITDCHFYDNTSRGLLNEGTMESIEITGTKFENFTSSCPIDNYGTATIGTLSINDCEFSNNNYAAIHGASGTHMDKLIVNNCYFHDSKRTAIFFEAPGSPAAKCDDVAITNSTFANYTNTNDYWASIIDIRNGGSQTDLGKVVVDHCTFYNNNTINTDHACVKVHKSTNVLVSNCIFAMPDSYERYATYLYGGNIKNCLTYNYTSGHTGATSTNMVLGDPLFTDAANGDFSYAGNWSTGEVSPARGAGTDGSDLGDPRWYTEEVLPETDFSTPYILSNLSPKISGSIGYDGEGKEIIYNGAQNAGTATWKVRVARACCVSASFHNGLASTHHLSIEIRDKENNVVGSPLEDINRYSVGDYAISGSLCFPEAGDYTIILSNTYSYTGAHISNLALTLVSEEVTIGSTGWATYCSDNALNFFGSDVEAYIVTGHSGNMLEKTRLNSTIPANTPLLLKADAGSYNIPKVSSSETSTTGNKLVRGTGSGVGYEEGKTRYVLMANSLTAEFQLLANGGASATVGTNKAYLEFNEVISLAPSALRLENEENNATSIEEVNSSDEAFKFIENGQLFIKKNGVVYDMMGRVIR